MESYRVTEFIDFLNTALNTAVFPEGAWIEGEVAEYRISQGKWIWFKLKDESATLDCFATVWGLRQPLEDGLAVRVYGRPKVHPKSGRFSFNVDRAEPVGEGALRRSFELLRQQLTEEGLFGEARKRTLPEIPQRIGLIASAESAAYGDFLRILGNRWGGLEIQLADVAVQGRQAVSQITAAFAAFDQSAQPLDAVVLVRGGGSLEDLQAFNTEAVCRAVFASRWPVVVGVGHERDVTLADMAADQRASTPSNAAELLVPDRAEMVESLRAAVYRLETAASDRVQRRQVGVQRLTARLDSVWPLTAGRVTRTIEALQRQAEDWSRHLEAQQAAVRVGHKQLKSASAAAIAEWQRQVGERRRLLQGWDPARLLSQGYAIVRRRGRVVRSPDQAPPGQAIEIQLANGQLAAQVTKTSKYGKQES
jgi:exodeoxyribonuclease VII large subunit